MVVALVTGCGASSAGVEPSAESSGDDPPVAQDPAPADDVQCTGEGERHDALDGISCCEGLTFLPEETVPGPCDTPRDPGPMLGVCSASCGDGSCQPIENECSCPSDCPGD